MNTSFPFVSIIIPTHNRSTLLSRTFTALSTQTYPAARMEVVLVADGCNDDTAVFARQYPAPWKLQVLEQPGLGPSIARNRGASLAQGEVLIFLDDDMEVLPEFVAAHVQLQETHPQMVAVGMLLSPQPPHDYFSKSLQNWWEGKFFQMRQPGHRFRYDDLFSGNLSIHADFFSQVGGFDPELHCHEDYELGVRLLAAGAVCELAMAAASYHRDATDIPRALQRRFAEGKADAYLVQKYPRLHNQLPMAHAYQTLLSRVLRFLAFWQPFLGDQLARLVQPFLPALEFFWLSGLWRVLLYYLQDYWYWRGIATNTRPKTIRALFAKKENHTPTCVLDLAGGIGAARDHLNATHPSSARVFIGKHWVGDIPEALGMEHLRGEHLPRILATEFSWQLAVAMSLDTLMPAWRHQGSTQVWQTAWELPLETEVFSGPGIELYEPKKIVEVELSNGIPDVEATRYRGLFALIRSHGRPLGCVTLHDLNGPGGTAMSLYQAIRKELGYAALPLALETPNSDCSTWPAISVIVCTRNRTSQLADCLQSLLDLDYPRYEILVIDNAPSDERTARLASHLPVYYIREERPGLDWARNCGLQEAHFPIVAFIDDDAHPDPGWLREIARVFSDPEVSAVTGSVLPARLETKAQNLFEIGYGGMNHGFQRRIFRRATCNDLHLLWASGFGVGTNMAFRKSVFDELEGFDVALDVGTPSSGGGDVEMFHRLVARGYTLVYEPAAIVWHSHRPEMVDLEKLVSNNGRSLGCYLLTCARNRTVGWFSILQFAIRAWLWGWIGKRLLHPHPRGFPRRLVWLELRAAFGSPFAYLRSQAHARRYARQIGRNREGQGQPLTSSWAPGWQNFKKISRERR